jgi:hypothetical protein
LKRVTIDFTTWLQYLHPIEKSRMQGPFFNTSQSRIKGQDKLICRLE